MPPEQLFRSHYPTISSAIHRLSIYLLRQVVRFPKWNECEPVDFVNFRLFSQIRHNLLYRVRPIQIELFCEFADRRSSIMRPNLLLIAFCNFAESIVLFRPVRQLNHLILPLHQVSKPDRNSLCSIRLPNRRCTTHLPVRNEFPLEEFRSTHRFRHLIQTMLLLVLNQTTKCVTVTDYQQTQLRKTCFATSFRARDRDYKPFQLGHYGNSESEE